VGIAEPQIRQHSIVPTLFPFTQVLTAYFWETVSSKKFVYDISEVDETLIPSKYSINIK